MSILFRGVKVDNNVVDVVDGIYMKKCTKCGHVKQVTEFVIRSDKFLLSSEYGYARKSYCTECKKAQNKKWRIANKEKISENGHTFYQKNKEKKRLYNKEYGVRHKEELAEKKHLYNQEHRESKRAYNREYREKHREELTEKERRYRLENKERISKRSKEHYEKHREESLEKNHKYYQENKEKLKADAKSYREEHAEECRANAREYNRKHKEERKAYSTQYREEHREELRQTALEYRAREDVKERRSVASRKRYAEDPRYKLELRLRNRLNRLLQDGIKTGSAVRDLGCSVGFLVMRLESMFYDHPETGEKMTWANHGKGPGTWQVDHILPTSKLDATDRCESLQLTHFTNLQPLWFGHNMRRRYQTMVEQLRDAMQDVLRRQAKAATK